MTTEVRERMHRDHFPCEVFDGERVFPVARVFVTDRRLIVHTEAGDVIDAPLASPVSRDRSSLQGELVVETQHGKVYVTRAADCGCSHPAKRVMPPVDW